MLDADTAPGEFALIAGFFSNLDQGPSVALGNGDDAALLRLSADETVAVSVDSMVEGVHFPVDSPGHLVAYRAVAAAVSDLAAMGAHPLGMTLALSLPAVDQYWLRDCREGLREASADCGLPLVGGDLVRGELSLTVQVIGAMPAALALRRSGAQVGDLVYVSGSLGDAAAGLALVQGRISSSNAAAVDVLKARFWRPQPALSLGVSLRGTATSAIDVSDGLLADLAHIASASQVQITIDSQRIPLSDALREVASPDQALDWALAGGDDYRLCFTVADTAAALPAECVMIGRVEAGSGVVCDALSSRQGFTHF
ncbi:MAG: thiamine-phosphate kinase [Congregibacter sp.]